MSAWPTCWICGYPIPRPNQPLGYAGNVCLGHSPGYSLPFRGDSDCVPAKYVTEEDVRRIVREELQRSQLETKEEP